MRLHPTKRELFAYAESLLDEGTAISAETGRHVADCERCASVVGSMKESLGFMRQAAPLEPSADLTARILAAARTERAASLRQQRGFRAAGQVAKGLGYAAALVLMASVSFRAWLGEESPESPQLPVAKTAETASAASPLISPEDIRRAAADIQALAPALDLRAAAPSRSPSELRRRGTVQVLNAELMAAYSALQRNPGCVRANHVVSSGLVRYADTLKTQYKERAF